MSDVFHATEKDNAAWVCDSIFISLWKLKFLAYLLNVTQRFVMRIVSYGNVYFICNYFSWLWTVGTEVVMPLGSRRGTGKEEENFSVFQGMQCSMFIKL